MRQADVVLSYQRGRTCRHRLAHRRAGAGDDLPLGCRHPREGPPLKGTHRPPFLSSFNHHPNVEGVKWFLLPMSSPGAWQGSGTHLSHLRLGHARRHRGAWPPYMTDPREAYVRGSGRRLRTANRIFVAPLLSGAGIKGKVAQRHRARASRRVPDTCRRRRHRLAHRAGTLRHRGDGAGLGRERSRVCQLDDKACGCPCPSRGQGLCGRRKFILHRRAGENGRGGGRRGRGEASSPPHGGGGAAGRARERRQRGGGGGGAAPRTRRMVGGQPLPAPRPPPGPGPYAPPEAREPAPGPDPPPPRPPTDPGLPPASGARSPARSRQWNTVRVGLRRSLSRRTMPVLTRFFATYVSNSTNAHQGSKMKRAGKIHFVHHFGKKARACESR